MRESRHKKLCTLTKYTLSFFKPTSKELYDLIGAEIFSSGDDGRRDLTVDTELMIQDEKGCLDSGSKQGASYLIIRRTRTK